MITPKEADALAQKLVAEYLNACECDSIEGAGNALMKLASVTGLTMCMVVGQADAVERLEATAAHIAKPEFAGPFKMEKLQ